MIGATRRLSLAVFAVVGALALGIGSGCRPEEGYRLADPSPPSESLNTEAAPAVEVLRLLEPDASIEREIEAEASHVYGIALATGDYLDLVVRQQSVDLVVRLLDPDGRELDKVDATGVHKLERLEALAERTGTHQVVVQPWKAATGRYTIRIEALRPAAEHDRTRVAAIRTFAEAERLRRQDRVEALPTALATYQEALRLWRLATDPLRETVALLQMGQLYVRLGDLKSAQGSFEEGLAVAAAHGLQVEEGRLLSSLGSVYRRTGDTEKAFAAFEEAQRIARETGERRVETMALNSLGLLYQSIGDLWTALRVFDRALEGWRELDESSSEAVTLHNIGLLYTQLGRTPEAFDALQRALDLRRTQGDASGEAATLNQIGWAHVSAGEAEAGLPYFQAALDRKREAGDRLGEASVLDRLGTAYRDLGRLAEAQVVQEQALAIVREAGNRRGEAHSLTNLGKLHEGRGEPDKALRLFGEAIALFREIEDPYGEAHALFRSAHAERRRGHLTDARVAIEAALTLVEDLRTAAASPALRASYFADAHKHYAFYVDLLMEMHETEPERGYHVLALEMAERGRARNLLDSLSERPVSANGTRELQRTLQLAINAKERERLKLLADGATEEEIEHVAAEVRNLLSEADKLQVQDRASDSEHRGSAQVEPLSIAEIQAQVLDEETLLLTYSLGEERSLLGLVSQTEVTVWELPSRAELEEAAMWLHGLLARSHKRGAGSQAELAATKLGETLLHPVAQELGGQRLLVVADGALQLVPFAALPIATADGEQVPLVAEHEIVRLPSASTLAAIRSRQAGEAPAPKLLAVLADPVFSREDSRLQQPRGVAKLASLEPPGAAGAAGIAETLERTERDFGLTGFTRLPHSRHEADAILAMAPAQETFRALGLRANREAVLDGGLAQYRIVHFATHGLLHPVHAELSGLVLSLVDEQGSAQDGFLRAHEIAGLDLPADLVVLSACRTALGKTVPGEGLLGLPRGFFRAGAQRVLVSLWNVSDQGTAELMERFYRGVLEQRLRPAAALRAAQLDLLREAKWQAPYYWAGFVLEGEWK